MSVGVWSFIYGLADLLEDSSYPTLCRLLEDGGEPELESVSLVARGAVREGAVVAIEANEGFEQVATERGNYSSFGVSAEAASDGSRFEAVRHGEVDALTLCPARRGERFSPRYHRFEPIGHLPSEMVVGIALSDEVASGERLVPMLVVPASWERRYLWHCQQVHDLVSARLSNAYAVPYLKDGIETADVGGTLRMIYGALIRKSLHQRRRYYVDMPDEVSRLSSEAETLLENVINGSVRLPIDSVGLPSRATTRVHGTPVRFTDKLLYGRF